jgi:hypothetical protein
MGCDEGLLANVVRAICFCPLHAHGRSTASIIDESQALSMFCLSVNTGNLRGLAIKFALARARKRSFHIIVLGKARITVGGSCLKRCPFLVAKRRSGAQRPYVE